MGKRNRRRSRGDQADPNELVAPNSDYTDAHGAVLTLRGVLSPATRREYAQVLAGTDGRPSATQEDTWQRAVELLFERLAVRWLVAGVDTEGQRELLGRLRLASPVERQWVRETLRTHCAEHFPDVQVP